MQPPVISRRDRARISRMQPDRVTFEMIELDRGLVTDLLASTTNLETEVGILIVADDVALGEATNRLEHSATDEERGAGHRRDFARYACRRVVTREPFEEMVIVPAAARVPGEVHSRMLERAVLEEQLRSRRAEGRIIERA